jgi:hypothetical protein
MLTVRAHDDCEDIVRDYAPHVVRFDFLWPDRGLLLACTKTARAFSLLLGSREGVCSGVFIAETPIDTEALHDHLQGKGSGAAFSLLAASQVEQCTIQSVDLRSLLWERQLVPPAFNFISGLPISNGSSYC